MLLKVTVWTSSCFIFYLFIYFCSASVSSLSPHQPAGQIRSPMFPILTRLTGSNICRFPSRHPKLTTTPPIPTSLPDCPPLIRFGSINLKTDLQCSKWFGCWKIMFFLVNWSQVQLQLPSCLGNSGRSFLHRGSMVIPKEHQHQQMLWASPLASSQFKPKANLKAVPQFPTLQNGTMVSWDGSFCCNSSPSSTFLRWSNWPKAPSLLMSQQHLHYPPQQLISPIIIYAYNQE